MCFRASLLLNLAALLFTVIALGEDHPPVDIGGAVVVDQQATTATTRHYDSAKPPAEMPPPSPGEAGVTVSQFSCQVVVHGSIIAEHKNGSQVETTVRVDEVHLSLKLDVAEWLATGTGDKILAHENGHRAIAEQFYQTAQDQAQAIGADLIGKTFTASADTREKASSAALSSAADQAATQYMARVRDPSEKVQEIYDHITAHGTNKVDEADAIRVAFREADRLASRSDGGSAELIHDVKAAN